MKEFSVNDSDFEACLVKMTSDNKEVDYIIAMFPSDDTETRTLSKKIIGK